MFYGYRQNNSFGRFDINEKVTTHVIIEADNADQANSKAEDIGIYFNGCSKGIDCNCCGDRWYPAYGEGTKIPTIYGEPVENEPDYNWVGLEPYAYVYFKDGTKKEYKSKR